MELNQALRDRAKTLRTMAAEGAMISLSDEMLRDIADLLDRAGRGPSEREQEGRARLAAQAYHAKGEFHRATGIKLPMQAQFFEEYWPIALAALLEKREREIAKGGGGGSGPEPSVRGAPAGQIVALPGADDSRPEGEPE